MKTRNTENFMLANGVVGLVADKTDPSPDIDRLMLELGHSSLTLPLYAIYPSDGRPPITFTGIFTESYLLEQLQAAGPSRDHGAKTAMAHP